MLSITPTKVETLFKPRLGDPRLGDWVKPLSEKDTLEINQESLVLLGCPDDLGVSLNKGRPGAKEGPDAIRSALFKMTLPMNQDWEQSLQLFDLGNIGVTQNILDTHRNAEMAASWVGKQGGTLIALGGGHDFAAPNFSGFKKGVGGSTFGLINVDPHLDARPWENDLPHSGTPFRTLLDSGALLGKHFVEFGARENRNAREHFTYCVSKGVNIQTFAEVRSGAIPAATQFQNHLEALSQDCQTLGVTIDMDCCFEAEGVSASPVLGFSAWELYEMALIAGSTEKVSYFELAEVAPSLDSGARSARIAAELIFAFLKGRASQAKI